MGTCKLRGGDRRESVIGYRSPGAKASSGGDGLSNYSAGRPAGRGIRPLPPRGKEHPGAGGKKPVRCLGKSRGPSGAGAGRRRALMCALLLRRQRMLRTRGAGQGTRISRTFPFASSRLKIQFQTPLSLAPAGPHAGSASRGARGRGSPCAGASTCAPRQRRPEKRERVPTMCL